MDPNATLQTILDGLDVDDTEKVSDGCESLNAWIDRGGFLPERLEVISRYLKERVIQHHGFSGDDSMEFRIYIRPDGATSKTRLEVETGDPCYDLDHSGFCGAGSIEYGASLEACRAATVAAFDDAIEFYFCQ